MDTWGFPVGRLCPMSTWECFWKTGAFRESRVAHGGGGCRADVFPTTCPSSPSRRPTRPDAVVLVRHGPQGGGIELVGDTGRVVVIGRDQVLIMSWFEPLAGIIVRASGTAPP